MIIKTAEFIISNKDIKKCPDPVKPEYAFIGRSNVGKSSLINMLVGKKNLAKTSATPGKTQLINHFLITSSLITNNKQQTTDLSEWYLVDLPGIGYAKTSKTARNDWEKMILNYFSKRTNLLITFILIDCRHPLQKIDSKLINWFGEHQRPFVIILTKTDKLKRGELTSNIANIKNELLKTWEELPQIIISSSVNNTGKDKILEIIEHTNPLFNPIQ